MSDTLDTGVDTSTSNDTTVENTANSDAPLAAPASEKPIEPTKAPEKKPEPAKPAPVSRRKIKVDGGEEEYGDEELVKLAQLGRASQKRFQEAAGMRKQAEDFIAKLKTDPRSVLTNPAIGVDLKKFAEDYLLEEIQKAEMSPEQQKIAEYERRLAELEGEKKAETERRQADERAALEKHYQQEFSTKIQEALSAGGLPKNPKTVRRMAEYMHTALTNGLDLEPKNVVELVRNDYMAEIMELVGQAEGDTLLQILGEPVANKIRKADLARLRASQAPAQPTAFQPAQPPQNGQPKHPETKRFMNAHDYREYLEKKFSGK